MTRVSMRIFKPYLDQIAFHGYYLLLQHFPLMDMNLKLILNKESPIGHGFDYFYFFSYFNNVKKG